MKNSDDAQMQRAIEQDRLIDAKAAELLNHEPELVALYQTNKQRKLAVKTLID